MTESQTDPRERGANQTKDASVLQGKIAVVTGAGGGIGAACARSLAARGCRVVLTYNSNSAGGEAVADRIDGVALPLDLADGEAIQGFARRVEEEVGAPQILVHNAGLIRDALVPFMSTEHWDEVQAVNLRGPFLLTRALIKGMLAKRWGRVINISSASGINGQLGQANYSAAKGGMIAFTKTLAREVARYEVTVNAIAPGFIDTDILTGMPEKKLKDYLDQVPLKRLGKPEEVSELAAFLASDAAAYITGQVLRVDGGLLMA